MVSLECFELVNNFYFLKWGVTPLLSFGYSMSVTLEFCVLQPDSHCPCEKIAPALTQHSSKSLRTYSTILWVPGVRFFGVKWPGYEVGHSLPPNVKIKNNWICTLLHLYAFTAWTWTNLPG
jgi:hypothetical protein